MRFAPFLLRSTGIVLSLCFLAGCLTVEEKTRRDQLHAQAQKDKARQSQVASLQSANAIDHASFREIKRWKRKIFRDNNVLALARSGPYELKIITSEQRGQLLVGELVGWDFPVTTGRKSHPTPFGEFKIVAKEIEHRSNLYGKIVDDEGNVVIGNADARKHKPAEDASFEGAPMPYFMRLTWDGVGLHVGNIPGYAASHGCIRIPKSLAPELYAMAPIGTKVRVVAR